MCKGHSGGAGSEGVQGSWRAAEAWLWERPGEAIGGGSTLVLVEGPGLKGHAEKRRLGIMKSPGEATGESTTQLQ